jgi:hypothetical protein
MLQLGERLELRVGPSGGGGEAVKLAEVCGGEAVKLVDECGGVGQGRDGEGGRGGVGAAGEEVLPGLARP